MQGSSNPALMPQIHPGPAMQRVLRYGGKFDGFKLACDTIMHLYLPDYVSAHKRTIETLRVLGAPMFTTHGDFEVEIGPRVRDAVRIGILDGSGCGEIFVGSVIISEIVDLRRGAPSSLPVFESVLISLGILGKLQTLLGINVTHELTLRYLAQSAALLPANFQPKLTR